MKRLLFRILDHDLLLILSFLAGAASLAIVALGMALWAVSR